MRRRGGQLVRRVENECRGGGHAPVVRRPAEFSKLEAKGGDGIVPVIPAGPGPFQRPVAGEERRLEHAGAGLQVGAPGLLVHLKRRQLLLTSEEGRLEEVDSSLQFFVRGVPRCSTRGRGRWGRGRSGGSQQSRRRGSRECPEASQLLLTGEDLGVELGDARLQVVAQGLRADGALVGGRRPLKEDCGVGRPASFQAVLEASLQPSVVGLGNCVAQKVGVVSSSAGAFLGSQELGVGSSFSST